MSPAHPDTLNATAQGQLKSLVERIERGEEEKAEVAAHIKEIYAEAKGSGFDAKILRRVIAYRKQDRAKRQEEEAVLDLYLSALGELPLFEPPEPEPPPSRPAPDGDVRVSLAGPGGVLVQTTVGAMKRATAQVRRSKSAA
jgi:uncharacterized protein (UPF0335 family)